MMKHGPKDPALRKARSCYGHLAGELGVLAYEGLQYLQVFAQYNDSLQLTATGVEWFLRFGVSPVPEVMQKRPVCKSCMDWSERRPHLGGALGVALLRRLYDIGWAHRSSESRAVQFSPEGEQAFRALFAK